MSKSLNFTSVAALQAYVREYAAELFGEAFVKFETAQRVTPHEGVKGQKVLTELIVGTLAKKWRGQFDGNDDVIDFNPRILQTYAVKAEFSFYAQEFEGNYLGFMRQKGQNPRDLPFERYILDKVLEKLQEEQEIAIWQGEIIASPTATDPLIDMIDGYLHILEDEITGSNLNPITTGPITSTNAVSAVEAVYGGLGDAYKSMHVDIFMSTSNRIKFFQDYRERYGKHTGQKMDKTMDLDIGNATIRGTAGMGSSDRIIITPSWNFHYGYDGANDDSLINFDMDKRELCGWIDFRFGAQIGLIQDNALAINDQA